MFRRWPARTGASPGTGGAKPEEDSEHVLLGKAVFKKGGQQVTVTKKLKFKAC